MDVASNVLFLTNVFVGLLTLGLVLCAGFLELINNMLTSGMVPALYPDDEKESIIGGVGPYLSHFLSICLTCSLSVSLSLCLLALMLIKMMHLHMNLLLHLHAQRIHYWGGRSIFVSLSLYLSHLLSICLSFSLSACFDVD